MTKKYHTFLYFILIASVLHAQNTKRNVSLQIKTPIRLSSGSFSNNADEETKGGTVMELSYEHNIGRFFFINTSVERIRWVNKGSFFTLSFIEYPYTVEEKVIAKYRTYSDVLHATLSPSLKLQKGRFMSSISPSMGYAMVRTIFEVPIHRITPSVEFDYTETYYFKKQWAPSFGCKVSIAYNIKRNWSLFQTLQYSEIIPVEHQYETQSTTELPLDKYAQPYRASLQDIRQQKIPHLSNFRFLFVGLGIRKSF